MEEFKNLFLLLKQYVDEQRENLRLSSAESMTRLLSALAVGFVCILLISIILLLLSFSLAYTIGELTGSNAIGFATLTGVVVIITIIFYSKRQSWIAQPLARLISSQLLDEETTIENIAQRHTQQKKKTEETGEKISRSIHTIMEPAPKPKNNLDMAIHIARNVFNIWQGVSLGMKIVRGFRSAFRR